MDGRFYPYGNEFDAAKGNTDEAAIEQTSAVGEFPGGASPCGALDLSGNVWEWTLSVWDETDDTNLRLDSRRVLRGGSWANDQLDARAASRDNFSPGARGYGIGFRLASPAPTPGPSHPGRGEDPL